MTPACITVSSSIINSMDRTVDPCNDFYEYACGGWVNSHPIPSGQSRWGTFGVMWQENQLLMRNALGKFFIAFELNLLIDCTCSKHFSWF